MTGGYVFTGVCPFTFVGGYPIPSLDGGIPHPRSGQGGYPIPGLDGGVPHLRSGWGVPHPRSGWGATPSKIWMGVPPSLDLMGYSPIQDWMWYPPGQDLMGYPLVQEWMGYPPHPRLENGVPPPLPIRTQVSKASTCYAAGGVPLALTQEDFLAKIKFTEKVNVTEKPKIFFRRERTELTCQHQGFPQPQIEWSKESNKIVPDKGITLFILPHNCNLKTSSSTKI